MERETYFKGEMQMIAEGNEVWYNHRVMQRSVLESFLIIVIFFLLGCGVVVYAGFYEKSIELKVERSMLRLLGAKELIVSLSSNPKVKGAQDLWLRWQGNKIQIDKGKDPVFLMEFERNVRMVR